MAHIIASSGRTAGTGFGSRLAQFREHLRARRAWKRTYLQVHSELSACSDRDLADIGISRHSIGDVAREAADRALS